MAKKVKQKEKSESSDQILNETNESEEPRKTKRKHVSFTEETIDNSEPIEDSPRKKQKKKNKKPKDNNVVIKPGIPTEQELLECDKPENKSAKVSKRQKKRQKYHDLLEKQKIESQINLQQKNLSYLSLWKHQRSEWKFEKLKQLWLQKNMFDDNLIPDKHWKTLIEYFSGAKGQIRQNILKECMEIIEKYEKQSTEDETGKEESKTDETEISEERFKRARDMLQNLEE